MNFRQLEYILAVKEQGHFRNAADNCFVSQATLSEMIRRLEEELDIQIFDRSRSPVVPTSEGEEVLKIAKNIVSQSKQLKQLNGLLKGKITGNLKIGVIPTVAPLLLPVIIKPFVNEYPEINLTIKEATTDQLISDLKLEKIDAAILATPLPNHDLMEYPLYTESLKVYGVLDKSKRLMSTKELKKSTIWLLEEGHCFKDQVVSICGLENESNQLDGLNIQCNSFATLVGLVDDFGGYTLLPEHYVKIMSRKRQNKTRSFEQPDPVRQISLMVYRPFVKKSLINALCKTIKSIYN